MPPVDPVALAGVIALLGDALVANPHLVEVELNPLRASPGGLVCLDALFVVDPPSER